MTEFKPPLTLHQHLFVSFTNQSELFFFPFLFCLRASIVCYSILFTDERHLVMYSITSIRSVGDIIFFSLLIVSWQMWQLLKLVYVRLVKYMCTCTYSNRLRGCTFYVNSNTVLVHPHINNMIDKTLSTILW